MLTNLVTTFEARERPTAPRPARAACSDGLLTRASPTAPAGKYYPDPEYERTSLWSFPLHQFGAPIAPARAKGEAAEAPPHGDQSEVFALTQCFSPEVDREVADVLEGWPWPYRPAFEPVEVGAA